MVDLRSRALCVLSTAALSSAALFPSLLCGCSRLEAEVGAEQPPGALQGRCDEDAPLKLYYWNARPQGITLLLNYLVKVENASGAALSPSSLKIRYYLTNELPASAALEVYYIDTCCSNKSLFNDQVLTSLVPIAARPNADAYLEIGFAPSLGPLAAGDAIQVEVGVQDPNMAFSVNQTNDYSYDANAVGTQDEWDSCPGSDCLSSFVSCKIVVLQNDDLSWGTPPE